MAVIQAPGNLMAAVTATGDSTNIVQRGTLGNDVQAVLRVVNVGTGSPTFTFTIQGSFDGTTFFNLPYATTAAPQTAVLTAITITASATNFYILQTTVPWVFLKTNISALTTETVTMDVL